MSEKEWYLSRHEGVIEYVDPDSASRFLYDMYWAVLTNDRETYNFWVKEVEDHVVGYKLYYKLPINAREMQELLRGMGFAINTIIKWDRRAGFKLILDWLFLASVYTSREPEAIYVVRGEKDGFYYVAVCFDYDYRERLKEVLERKIEDLKRKTTQQ